VLLIWISNPVANPEHLGRRDINVRQTKLHFRLVGLFALHDLGRQSATCLLAVILCLSDCPSLVQVDLREVLALSVCNLVGSGGTVGGKRDIPL